MEDRSWALHKMRLDPKNSQWPSTPKASSRSFDPHLSPQTLTPRSTTASQVLAQFSPRPQPKKSPSSNLVSPQKFPIAMEAKRSSRRTERISYEISDDSEDPDTSSSLDSTFSTPQKAPRKRVSIVDLEDELAEIEPPKTPPPRLSSAGHALRQPNELALSLRAQENGDKRVTRKRKTRKSRSKPKIIIQPSAPDASAPKTARQELREYVNTETAGKRSNFFVAQKDLFLPLLPESNHVQRLVAQQRRVGKEAEDLSVPYKVIDKQPAG